MTDAALIGVPCDLGANVPGARLGPDAIRAHLIPRLRDSRIKYLDLGDIGLPPKPASTDAHARYAREILEVCALFDARVRHHIPKGALPIILGGDHSVGYCAVRQFAKADEGLLWFDAHGDFNTEATTPSGNVHGMPVAAISGLALQQLVRHAHPLVAENRIALVGVRDLDPGERALLDDSQITVFGIHDIRQAGLAEILRRAFVVAGTPLHASFDIDVIDPQDAPGVSTPLSHGLSRREGFAIMQALGRAPLSSFMLAELNPLHDVHEKTAKLAAELIFTLLAARKT